MKEIMEALKKGQKSYQLKYAVKVKRHWGKVKIDKEGNAEKHFLFFDEYDKMPSKRGEKFL